MKPFEEQMRARSRKVFVKGKILEPERGNIVEMIPLKDALRIMRKCAKQCAKESYLRACESMHKLYANEYYDTESEIIKKTMQSLRGTKRGKGKNGNDLRRG